MSALRRFFDPQLPRDVWLLQLGGVMNSFGNGATSLPLVKLAASARGGASNQTNRATMRRRRITDLPATAIGFSPAPDR